MNVNFDKVNIQCEKIQKQLDLLTKYNNNEDLFLTDFEQMKVQIANNVETAKATARKMLVDSGKEFSENFENGLVELLLKQPEFDVSEIKKTIDFLEQFIEPVGDTKTDN